MSRPLLYLDVDGPLNPWAAEPERLPAGYTTHLMHPGSWIALHPGVPPDAVPTLRVRLDPAHGPRLLELASLYELVWATTWGDDANVHIGPVLGLPHLPVVHWPELFGAGEEGTYWKTAHLVAHAAGRPFAWVDDEITDADRTFVAARHEGPALLHLVDPRHGLADADFTALDTFARSLGPLK